MSGLVLALLASISFAVANAYLRKATHQTGESFTPVPISAFLGLLLFGILIIPTGELAGIMSMSWVGFIALAGAGVIHFVIGRMGAYIGLRLIGSNRTAPILTSSTIIATIIAVVFLGEALTGFLVLAILLVVGGVILVSITNNGNGANKEVNRGNQIKGVLAVVGTSVLWGISPTLTKIGLNEVGSSFQAIFVSYLAASAVIGMFIFYPGNWQKLRRLTPSSWLYTLIGAAGQAMAQLCIYTALVYTPVSIVMPIVSAQGLLVFPVSFLVNRKLESFHSRVILGAIAIVAGITLIFWTS